MFVRRYWQEREWTVFKASVTVQDHFPYEARRVLQMDPRARTDRDIDYVSSMSTATSPAPNSKRRPTTRAITGYPIYLEKLSANEQFFVGAQMELGLYQAFLL